MSKYQIPKVYQESLGLIPKKHHWPTETHRICEATTYIFAQAPKASLCRLPVHHTFMPSTLELSVDVIYQGQSISASAMVPESLLSEETIIFMMIEELEKEILLTRIHPLLFGRTGLQELSKAVKDGLNTLKPDK